MLDNNQDQQPQRLPSNQPNLKHSGLIFFLCMIIVALISGGGVYFSQQNKINQLLREQNINLNSFTEPKTVISQAISNPDSAQPSIVETNKITLDDIMMTIPSKWKIESNTNDSAVILTDNPKYKVELIVNLQNQTISASNFQSSINKTKTKYGEAFKVTQGGAFAVTGITMNGKIYSFEWEINSNEPIPTDLDGIWVPKHNVSETDIWDMTLTAKPAN
jgi:hypothetical protein